MPKYTYKCKECNDTKQIFSNRRDSQVQCPICKNHMSLQMPNLLGQQVSETVDTEHNTKWMADQKDILAERKADHFWKHEVPKMVNSGVYSIETMLENSWVYFDDKDQMQINTKPPGKR